MTKLFASIMFFLVLMGAGPAHATLKYYEYDGNLPLIDMMLNMMTVMGILEKVPVDYMYDIANRGYNNYPGVAGAQPPNINVFSSPPAVQPYPGPPYNRFSRHRAGPGAGTVKPRRDCRTMLCGNQVRMLNGLWVAENGEMLGVKNHKFLWNDGAERYLTGVLQVRDGKMIARPDGKDVKIRFQITIKNKTLMMRDQNGAVKHFRKVSFNNQQQK